MKWSDDLRVDVEPKLDGLLVQIRRLEEELVWELNRRRAEIRYEIRRRKVCFRARARQEHRRLVKSIPRYLFDARKLNFLVAPVVWAVLPPALFLDITVCLYQTVCFPVWNIPKVRRSDFIVIDRHTLAYLNWIEKFNCIYCGYFNGLAAYLREVAARTEQHWCPVKHAGEERFPHSRYKHFVDFGDAEGFQKHFSTLRRDFNDIE